MIYSSERVRIHLLFMSSMLIVCCETLSCVDMLVLAVCYTRFGFPAVGSSFINPLWFWKRVSKFFKFSSILANPVKMFAGINENEEICGVSDKIPRKFLRYKFTKDFVNAITCKPRIGISEKNETGIRIWKASHCGKSLYSRIGGIRTLCCVVRALQYVTIIRCTAPIFRVLTRWWPLLLRSERKNSFSKCKIRSLIMEWSLVWTVQTNSNCHILSQTFNEIQMFIQIIEANIPISKQFQIWMNTSTFTAIIFVWSR